MLRFQFALRILIVLLLSVTGLKAFADSGPDNGTDAVKVLFAEAHWELKKHSLLFSVQDIDSMELDEKMKLWLQTAVQGLARWQKMKESVLRMRLEFQTAPCEDSQGRTASICYFDENPSDPYVLVSLLENRNTDKERAMAMLLHEAGHFVGEKDHLFLDQLGVALVQAFKAPRYLSVSVASVELVPNVFLAKSECESGVSQQAQNLLKKAEADLTLQCLERGYACDFLKANHVFTGNIEFENGIGFSMKVTCELKTVLPLKGQ